MVLSWVWGGGYMVIGCKVELCLSGLGGLVGTLEVEWLEC
jgi:hypothetical protein